MPKTATVTLAELAEVLSSSAGARVTAADMEDGVTFAELGVDSLGVLGVISSFERSLGITLPADVHETESVSEFLNLVNDTVRKAG